MIFEDIAPDVRILEGELPDEARFVRRLGCPKTRQFDVYEMGYSLFMVETPIEERPQSETKVAVIGCRQLLNTTAARLLKSNDGVSVK